METVTEIRIVIAEVGIIMKEVVNKNYFLSWLIKGN